MKVLLVGGGGFISSAVESRLRREGATVTVLNRSGRVTVAGSTGIRGDRNDPDCLGRATVDVDAVVDFLCHDRATADQIIQALRGRHPRHVMISTGSVYWCTGEWMNPVGEDQYERADLAEKRPGELQPGSVEYAYGRGKREAEAALAAAGRRGDLRSVRLRFPVVSGPADPSGRYTGYLRRVRTGRPLLIPAGGFNAFRHLFVEDAAAAVSLALERDAPAGGYNVAGREILSVRDLVRQMAECLGRPEPEVVGIPPALLTRWGVTGLFAPFSCSRDQILDASLAGNDLGFRPTPGPEWLAATVEHAAPSSSEPVGAGLDSASAIDEEALIARFRRALQVA